VRLQVLTWNLMHGRAIPSAGRDLLDDYSRTLAAWSWDVALLQEVPPWWPPALADAAGGGPGRAGGATARWVLTSRNGLPALRRWIAIRWPDLIRSNGGGANAILVRGRRITAHRSLLLRRFPERRWLHAVALGPAGEEVWVGNVHLSGHRRAAVRETELAAAALRAWAEGAPCVLGGDFNLFMPTASGLVYAGGVYVDHMLASRMRVAAGPEVPDRGRLSDHAPVVVTLER
jgi:endonuclease/exonuclease/phosphatase family metal-dependent hydrolase